MEINNATACTDVFPEFRPNTFLFFALYLVFEKIAFLNVNFDPGDGFFALIGYVLCFIYFITYSASHYVELVLMFLSTLYMISQLKNSASRFGQYEKINNTGMLVTLILIFVMLFPLGYLQTKSIKWCKIDEILKYYDCRTKLLCLILGIAGCFWHISYNESQEKNTQETEVMHGENNANTARKPIILNSGRHVLPTFVKVETNNTNYAKIHTQRKNI